MVVAIALAGAPRAQGTASARPTAVAPADRAATHAYLQAEYEYNQAVLAAAPAEAAAVDAAASQIGSECPGVLAGAPRPKFSAGPPRSAPGPRREGEENRLQTQVSALEGELSVTLGSAAEQPRRGAELTLASKLMGLRWSERRLTLLIHYMAKSIEQGTRAALPPLCADMRAWVASGYTILAPATKALVEHEQTELARLFALALPELLLSGMKRYNGPAEDALEYRLHALRRRVSEARSPAQATYARLLGAVGLPSRESEREAARPRPKRKPPVEIGHGRTASGGRYSVWAGAAGSAHECKTNVEVRQGERVNADECIPGFGPARPTVKCVGGLLTIDLVTTSAVRSVELRLSNGARIVSRPIRFPARFGGPAGLYYQQVRGPAPVPVALVELSARGRTLRTLKLERLMGCTKRPFRYLPGGFRVLSRGREPRGRKFAIVAERYSLFGVVHFELRAEEGSEAGQPRQRTREPEGPFEESLESEGGVFETVAGPLGRRAMMPFAANVESGCHPYEHALVYGLLRSPDDRVFVKVDGRTERLSRVPIPTDMHAGGALAYGAFASAPEAVIVRSPNGRVVTRENRRPEAKDQREMCEGEAEGAGPTVGEDGGSTVFLGAI